MSLIRIDQHINNESNTNDQHENETEANVYDEMNPNEVADILNNNQIKNYYSNETENLEESNETEHSNNEVDDESEEELSEVESNTDESESVEDDNDELVKRTESGRVSKPPEKLNLHQCHLQTQRYNKTEYSFEKEKVISQSMIGFNNKGRYQFIQAYGLKRELKHFGEKGYNAAMEEMKQLHKRAVFNPINVHELTQKAKRRALESLIFLVEKRNGRVKARTCANGSTQRSHINKEDVASPTALKKAFFITAAIKADEQRDIVTVDIPNAFVQTNIENNQERVMMKIKGPLAEMLIAIDPEMYENYAY
jgi:hypothetical protein